MKIVKILSIVSVLSFGMVGMNANAADGKFAIGPQGGLVFSDYDVENSPFGTNYDNENGFLAGLFTEFGVWTVTLRPELNYVEKGYTFAGAGEITHKYLEVPVLLKVNPFGDFVVSPFLVLGPSFNYHIESEVERAAGNITLADTADDWDISGVAGLGLEFNVAENVGFNLQGRYNFGFRDVDETAAEVRSRGIYALAGVSLQY